MKRLPITRPAVTLVAGVMGMALLSSVACTRKPKRADATANDLSNAPAATPLRIDESSTAIPGAECKVANPESLWRFARPVDPTATAPDAAKFAYTVELRPPATPDLPVVVFLPGGPGSTSIGSNSLFPPNWGVMNTDPRGVGCNAYAGDIVPERFYDSDVFAADVVTAIERTRTTKVILFGLSYGTLLATKVAAALNAKGFTGVHAVVLEGVLGRPFTTAVPPQQEYLRQWKNLRATFTPDERKAFDAGNPAGIDDALWGRYLMTWLPAATYYDPRSMGLVNPVHAAAKAVVTTLTGGALDPILAQVRNPDQPLPENKKRLYRNIACREISNLVSFVDVRFEKGVLSIDRSDDVCAGLPLSRPFDAAAHPFRYDTYYFQGGTDPATPPWQGQYHASVNTRAKRTVVVATRAGHNPLSLSMNDCRQKVWEAIDTKTALDAVLGTCALTGSKIEVLPAAP